MKMNDLADAGKTNPIKPEPLAPVFTPKTNIPPKNNLKKSQFSLNQDIFSLVYDMRYASA